MFYGGDYNPEQWPESTWLDDVRLMREARVNLVAVGVFAWARIQPDEGEFDFGWLDRVLDLLADDGIGVNLATATASPPPWATQRYPGILPVTADGVRLQPGARQHYAATSPDYRRLAAQLVGQIAGRYVDHPAVRMWHVNNEYGCHVHHDYSENAATAFRGWLERKYGDISGLNRAWGTEFWSQAYGSFDQVAPPRRAPYNQNPAAVLDFYRFTSDVTLELYVMERDIIRAAGASQPITTNFMGAFPYLDYWRWAQEIDVVGDDSYPDPRDPEAFRGAAFTRDLMRSLKPGTPWLLMEQASSAVNFRSSNKQKRPGQMAALSQQAVARGAAGVMFFQWRQSTSGTEKFHSAMLSHAGTDTRTWREVRELGQDLADRPAVAPAPAQVALTLDWENRWALELPDHPAPVDYGEEIRTWYDALHVLHVQTDIVHPAHDLSGYKLVVAPALYLLSEAAAENLRRYVHDGGVLITTAFTDIVDETDRFLPGGFATRLGEVFGGRVVDFDGLSVDDAVTVTFAERVVVAHTLREEFLPTAGRVTAVTSDGDPALVEHHYGRGRSFHTTVFVPRDGASAVVRAALGASGASPVLPGLPEQVEAIATDDGVTLINHSEASLDVVVDGAARILPPFAVETVAAGEHRP